MNHIMISKEKARISIVDKKSLHKSLLRNGHILPQIKDPLLSIKFMTGILHNKYWSLTTSNMVQSNFKIAADPPPKRIIADMLSAALIAPSRMEELKNNTEM